jgi:hypothetical protein
MTITHSHQKDGITVTIEVISIEEVITHGRYLKRSKSVKSTFTSPLSMYTQALAKKLPTTI